MINWNWSLYIKKSVHLDIEGCLLENALGNVPLHYTFFCQVCADTGSGNWSSFQNHLPSGYFSLLSIYLYIPCSHYHCNVPVLVNKKSLKIGYRILTVYFLLFYPLLIIFVFFCSCPDFNFFLHMFIHPVSFLFFCRLIFVL